MSYPYAQFKVYVAGEILTASDLNSSDVKHANQNIPEDIDDYSVNVTEMRLTADPYPGASPSLATELDGELMRLRYQLNAIIGKTYWYEDPDATIASLKTQQDTNTSDITDLDTNKLNLSGGTLTGQLVSSSGNANAPGISIGTTDTGFFIPAATFLAITCNGSEQWRFTPTGIIPVNTSSVLYINTGSAGTPSLAFNNDTNTGIYGGQNDRLYVACGGSRVATFGLGQIQAEAGSISAPSHSFNAPGGTDVGMYLSGSATLGFNCSSGGNFLFSEGATVKWRYDGGNDAIQPETTDTIKLGTSTKKWSDMQSVLINGSDYGFANGWILREYPATYNDVQTKSDEWMKANADKGIQVLNKEGTLVCVIGKNGKIYANGFESLDKLSELN